MAGFIKSVPVILFWLLVWECVSWLISSEIIIVSPRITFARLFALAQTPYFWQSIGTSLGRILRGFLLSLGAGVVFAGLSARFKIAHRLIQPAINTINAVPIASFTILALMAFHSSNLSVFVAFVTVLPIVFHNTFKGIESADPHLLEMANIFRVPVWKKILYIYVKTVAPFVVSAAMIGIGFAWKSGIAAELIGAVSGTIGANLHTARIFLNTADLFAWTIAIVLLSYIMERAFRLLRIDFSIPQCFRGKPQDFPGKPAHPAGAESAYPPIELKNIGKSFGEPPNMVLRDVSLTFRTGITCIMGPSGVGKTTLVNVIAGLVKPDSGAISGMENKRLSMVFQEDRLLENETALSNILFVNKDPRRAAWLLKNAGLSESINKKAAELSGGMKRRVCLCRALAADYDVLILDEPFKGLDSGIKPSIMQMVKNNAKGIVICITHDPAEAEFLGEETVYLGSL
ncbi:MAG: ATP-binding cassette domain-containing protein [Defluviitaleaceae bacterium]|nr:ATP-binding cassette domain-containing protein [Defluviitaleaceae bacterium]